MGLLHREPLDLRLGLVARSPLILLPPNQDQTQARKAARAKGMIAEAGGAAVRGLPTARDLPLFHKVIVREAITGRNNLLASNPPLPLPSQVRTPAMLCPLFNESSQI